MFVLFVYTCQCQMPFSPSALDPPPPLSQTSMCFLRSKSISWRLLLRTPYTCHAGRRDRGCALELLAKKLWKIFSPLVMRIKQLMSNSLLNLTIRLRAWEFYKMISQIKHKILHKIIQKREPEVILLTKIHLFCYTRCISLSIKEYRYSEWSSQSNYSIRNSIQ